MGVALGLGAPVVGDVDLAADDGFDAVLGRLSGELHGPGERPVIGERDRGHPELGGPSSELGNPASPVQNGVLGVDVKVDEGGLGFWHGTPILVPA